MESLQTLLQYAMTAVNFMIIITLLVFVHELGHFWFAKLFGMKVDSFAVMVGGIRKTDLEVGLPKRMLPARIVGLAYGLTLLGTALCAMQDLRAAYLAGLFLLAFIFPVWIGWRINTLYRLPITQLVKTMGIAYVAALGILTFSTRGSGFSDAASVLLICFYASIVALLYLYYQPLSNKLDESEMGHGSVREGETVIPVRFRPVWYTTSKEGTEFSLLALPLGGFASMRGMAPKPDGSEVHVEGGFYSKSPYARFMVLFAGPLFSILLGSVLFFTAFVSFGQMDVSDEPIIGGISPGMPASKAGIKEGDKILSMGGSPVTNFYDIVVAVRSSSGKPLEIAYERGGVPGTTTVTPELEKAASPVLGPGMEFTDEVKRQYKFGAGPSTKMVRLAPAEAARRALEAPMLYGKQLLSLFAAPQRAAESFSGPAAIVKETHNASQAGLYPLLILAAVLSTSLGFMNLLPVPPLDGGQMMVALAEMFRRGRRLSIETQYTITTVGAFLVMALMVFVVSQDAGRLLGGK